MHVLITGGTGFLGRHTAIRLKQRGLDVAIMGRNDRIGAVMQRYGIRYVKADLADAAAVIEGCRDRDHVIHCGGLASPWGNYENFYSANVIGTQNVIEGCRRYRVDRLVHVSTPSLYFDYRDRLNIKESDPLPKPATHYAATKGLADQAVEKAFREGLPSIGIRPRALFGPGDQAVLVRLLRAADKGKIPLVGGGRSFVDLTYIDNAVDALELCLQAPQTALGRNYNITNGEPLTMQAMVELLFSQWNQTPKAWPLPFPLAFGAAALMETWYRLFRLKQEPPLTRYAVGLMAKSQTLDISAACATLGYKPRISLKEGMRRFADWWRRKDGDVPDWEKLGLASP